MADGVAEADLAEDLAAAAEALEASVAGVASAVVAGVPVGEIQSRCTADIPSVFREVRNA